MNKEEGFYNKACLAFDESKNNDGIELLHLGVEEGELNCMGLLASIYLDGEFGEKKDVNEACRLFEIVAGSYHIEGTFVYGRVLYFGHECSHIFAYSGTNRAVSAHIRSTRYIPVIIAF